MFTYLLSVSVAVKNIENKIHCIIYYYIRQLQLANKVSIIQLRVIACIYVGIDFKIAIQYQNTGLLVPGTSFSQTPIDRMSHRP